MKRNDEDAYHQAGIGPEPARPGRWRRVTNRRGEPTTARHEDSENTGRGGFFRPLSLVAAIATVLLFGVGGLVRGTGSGLGCSSWPRCNALHFLPPLSDTKGLIEYSHRGLAAVVIALLAAEIIAVLAIPALRSARRLLWGSITAGVLVLAQAALGAIVVENDLNPRLVTAHFATAMALVAVTVLVAVDARIGATGAADAPARPQRDAGSARFARLVTWTTAAMFALLLVGTYVRARSAGLAFRDWPLMNGRLVPALGGAATLMFAHRLLAAGSLVLVLWVAIRARTMVPRVRTLTALSLALLVLFVAQIFAGALNVWTDLRPGAVTLHVFLSAVIWAVIVALWEVAHRGVARSERAVPAGAAMSADRPAGEDAAGFSDPTEEPGGASLRDTTRAYFQLTKPRIIVLLLITTVPAMMLAARGIPSLWLILATLLGGTVAAGSANAINCYLDRDIDEVMRRTRKRPLPSGRVEPEQALTFGFVLGAISFFFLSITVNVLAATLALSAIAFYVFVYTMWLKRSTPQNIVIGGAAGAVPALVGWAAVTGTLGAPAWILFAIVFVWTPPHFWALAMRYQGDYAAAGVPMLPAVRGDAETRKQILLYSLVLFGTSLLLVPFAHMGPVYTSAAVVLGAMFCYRALRLYRGSTPALAMRLFAFSILYLALLFAAVAVDSVSAVRF